MPVKIHRFVLCDSAVDPRLFLAFWRAPLGSLVPVMVLQMVMELVDHGIGRDGLLGVLTIPLIWAVVLLVWAVAACRSLSRRARGTGLPLTVAALEETQVVTVPGDLARVRDRLGASGRASHVKETADGELVFRWRPFRSRRWAPGSVTYDGTTGSARVEIRAGDGHRGAAGLRKGTAFIAVCQIARAVSP